MSLFVIWEVTVSRILFRNRFVVYSMDVSCFLRESDFLFFCCVSFATLFLPLSKSIRRKLNTKDLLQKYLSARAVKKLTELLTTRSDRKYRLVNNAGSVTSLIVGAMRITRPGLRVVVLNDREEAAYFYNDILALADEKQIAFLPSSYRRMIKEEEKDNDSVLVRTEVLNNIRNGEVDTLITYPEALAEKVVDREVLARMSMVVNQGDALSISFVENLLVEYGFERNDFVYEPGQFSIRGSIVDVYSFAEEQPVRIDFFGDEVESIRFFDIETQLSDKKTGKVSIVPDLSGKTEAGGFKHTDLSSYFSVKPVWWIKNGMFLHDKVKALYAEAGEELVTSAEGLMNYLEDCHVVEWGPDMYFRGETIDVACEPQPPTNKHFDLLAETLQSRQANDYRLYICSNNEMQIQRIRIRMKRFVFIRNIRFSIVIINTACRLPASGRGGNRSPWGNCKICIRGIMSCISTMGSDDSADWSKSTTMATNRKRSGWYIRIIRNCMSDCIPCIKYPNIRGKTVFLLS